MPRSGLDRAIHDDGSPMAAALRASTTALFLGSWPRLLLRHRPPINGRLLAPVELRVSELMMAQLDQIERANKGKQATTVSSTSIRWINADHAGLGCSTHELGTKTVARPRSARRHRGARGRTPPISLP